MHTVSRRGFLALVPLLLLHRRGGAMEVRVVLGARPGPGRHPDPRPGITAARVLRASKLTDPSAAPVFDMVREIPHVVDGIRCWCGCADVESFYSLLTCFEQGGMAQHCVICQGQARLAYKLHAGGWTLAGIRSSIDATYGD